MGRFLVYVIFFIISVLIDGPNFRRGRRWGRYRYYYGNTSFNDYEMDQVPRDERDNWLYKFVTSSRRDRHVKKNRNYMKKADGIYKLFNTKVICEYSPKDVTFKYTDLRNQAKSATAVMNLQYMEDADCVKVLDSILFSFDAQSNYEGIDKVLKDSGYFLLTYKTPIIEKNTNAKNSKPAKKDIALSERVNINKANEEGLAKLPGINVVKAKKLLQYRVMHGGFKSVDEFIKVAKVKPHFIEGIKANVFLGIKMDNETKPNERTIDF